MIFVLYGTTLSHSIAVAIEVQFILYPKRSTHKIAVA